MVKVDAQPAPTQEMMNKVVAECEKRGVNIRGADLNASSYFAL